MKLFTSKHSAESETREERRRSKLLVVWRTGALLVVTTGVLALPTPAHADIFGVFDSIFSTIQSDMGASLTAINQMTQAMQQLYQTTVWPLSLVNSARGFVANTITSYRTSMTQVFHLSSPSATLPSPQQLETILHSRTSSQIPALQTSFTTNYGSVPATNVASPQDRVMVDMDDALGQENFKTTLIADQGQDLVLSTADQMENQVAVSAPGSTPFLTAQAQIANLRCQAFTQKMLAAELRQEAGRIAHDNALMKRRATSTSSINQFISGSLTHQ